MAEDPLDIGSDTGATGMIGSLASVMKIVALLVVVAGGVVTLLDQVGAIGGQPCQFSGVAVNPDTEKAYVGAEIGYASDRLVVSLQERNDVKVEVLATTDRKGKYKGTCDGVEDREGRFEVLARDGRKTASGELRCRRVTYSGRVLANDRVHTNVNVLLTPCRGRT